MYKKGSSLDFLYAFLVAFIWSGDYIVKKFLVSATNIPPYLTVSLQCALVAVILFPFCPKLPTKKLKLFFISFLWGPLCYGSMLMALKCGMPVNVASIIAKTNIIFHIILSIIFLKENIDFRILFGLSILIIGAFTLIEWSNIELNILSIVFILLFGMASGSYYFFIRYFKIQNSLSLVCWVSIFTVPQTMCISLVFESYTAIKDIFFADLIPIIYLAIFGKIIGLSIWNKIVIRNSSHKILPISLTIPFITSVLSYFIYGEIISKYQILSIIIILVGLITLNIKKSNV
ncbi:EamA family transporter [Anaplasmataceae bacterium AB001_6]|nr:EamA family transporter [Anaplasmataceae bacterium AB001_6]